MSLDRSRQVKSDGRLVLCSLLLVGGLTLGGGTRPGFPGDVILQIASIPVLLIALQSATRRWADRHVRAALLFCAALVLLPALQLLPMPPALWTLLPGRQPLTEVYDVIGAAPPWRPLSVSARLTWLSMLSLLPPLAIFFAVVAATNRQRRLLSLVAILTAVGSAFIGLLQVAQGADSPLYFYEVTNPTEAVGFFANRNHFAALMYCAILLVGAWSVTLPAQRAAGGAPVANSHWVLLAALAAMGLFVLVCAAAMARSRAGILLSMGALVAILALANGRQSTMQPERRFALAAVVIAAVLIAEFALYRIMERFAVDPMSDARVGLTKTTLAAAWQQFPFGSGLGTFVPVYAIAEQPADLMLERFINHAHNDYAQAVLEGGAAAIGLGLAFLIWLLRRARDAWRRSPDDGVEADVTLARAAVLILVLIGLHSFVDYPLRTTGIMTVAAFCAGLLINPRPERGSPRPVVDLEVAAKPEPVVSAPAAANPPGWARKPWPSDVAGPPTATESTVPWPVSSAAPPVRPQAEPVPGASWNDSRLWPEEWRPRPQTESKDPAPAAASDPDKKAPEA